MWCTGVADFFLWKNWSTELCCQFDWAVGNFQQLSMSTKRFDIVNERTPFEVKLLLKNIKSAP